MTTFAKFNERQELPTCHRFTHLLHCMVSTTFYIRLVLTLNHAKMWFGVSYSSWSRAQIHWLEKICRGEKKSRRIFPPPAKFHPQQPYHLLLWLWTCPPNKPPINILRDTPHVFPWGSQLDEKSLAPTKTRSWKQKLILSPSSLAFIFPYSTTILLDNITMGNAFTKLFSGLFSKQECRILMVCFSRSNQNLVLSFFFLLAAFVVLSSKSPAPSPLLLSSHLLSFLITSNPHAHLHPIPPSSWNHNCTIPAPQQPDRFTPHWCKCVPKYSNPLSHHTQ